MTPDSLLKVAAFTPKSLQFPNAWVGHLPFAAWVIMETSPKIFVELGTHSGNSYFSFCQAVVEANALTKCYAVDTWQGDEHAGEYADDVYLKVNAHNQKNFAGFSQLLRMTFDDAFSHFADESIDLLHIDGLHTYEAVRHDFESWLPKLAPGALVIFHDTNVYERNFGVWKLWLELQARYSNNLEFMHSNGLGVLQLNNGSADKRLDWLQPDSFTKQQVLAYFAALGSRQLEYYELIEFKTLVVERDKQLHERGRELYERGRELSNLSDEVVKRGRWALLLEGELKEERGIRLLMAQSNSWRITLPLREAKRWFSNPKQQGKKYVKGGLRLIKHCYQLLPLSHQTKAVHRKFLAKYFSKILLASGSHSASVQSLAIPVLKRAVREKIVDPVNYAKSLDIPTSQSPAVSVIVPVYGKIEYTLHCLISISENLPEAAFEIIVVDDCSTDNSAAVLESIEGVRLIRNQENQGFIRSCNVGARAARGEHLYFLNNDTEVTLGWMDALLRTFKDFPGTGLVGSRLVYPDGRLQEAGGIIWQNGTAWNFGRFQDPFQPIYNYAREVDYCSGASIVVPKVLFDKLGGFDECYLPAYCEDCDLALKIRAEGLRVIYQPLSTVFHYEGVTSGTDTSTGTKAYQIENTKKLQDRWQRRLQNHQPAGSDVDNAKDRRATRRVLVIDHCTPTPNQDAGSLIIFNLFLLLREMDFQVTFIPEDNFLYLPEFTTELQRVGIEVLYGPYVNSVEQHVKELGDRYSLVLLVRPTVVERHISTIRKYCPQTKVLFHTVDLHFLRMSREAALQADEAKRVAADQMKHREFAAIGACDASIVVSTVELELLRTELPHAKVYVLPLIMEVPGTSQPFSSRRDIAFVGGYQHSPNVDAVKYFVAEVMPMLRLRLPGVRFYAIGSNPPAEVKALAADDVIVTGFVENLSLELDKMRVSVAPLRYGAGIKGKIGSAVAVGLPVVATSLAAEGMSLTDGENILIANGAEHITDAVVALYQNEFLWNRISQNGIKFSEYEWGAESAWKRLTEILSSLNLSSVQNSGQLSLYGAATKEASLVEGIVAVELER